MNILLTVRSNNINFNVVSQKIPQYPMEVSESPIQVDLSLNRNNVVYALGVTDNLQSIAMENSTAIIVDSTDIPKYTGDYVVIPKAKDETVLATKNKKCVDNITVTKIPTYSTHNDYGVTFYIAEGTNAG